MRVLLVAAALLAGVVAATEPASAVPSAVPSPVVTGLIPAKARPGDPSHDYPFFATDRDLRAYGYVEEEYFVEGTANRYTTPDGATGAVVDGGRPPQHRSPDGAAGDPRPDRDRLLLRRRLLPPPGLRRT